jgi:amino acid transporter
MAARLDPNTATTTRAPQALAPDPVPAAPGLRHDAVGLVSTISVGLASVAPAYSITVTLGFVVLVAGKLAPAALLAAFVPILCTAFAFRELNRAMPDCGTNFVWITKAFGPWSGWLLGNWVPQAATVLAMTALAQVGAVSLLGLLGLGAAATHAWVVTAVGLGLVAVVVTVAVVGIEMSARVQNAMVALQLVALLVFGIAATVQGGGDAFSLGWLNPLGFPDASTFAEAVLLAIFIYWGWDSALTLNEEAHDGARVPGKAAVISTVVLLGTYLFTAIAALRFAGSAVLGGDAVSADVLGALAPDAMGSGLARIVQLAICLSAVGALLTCVVASARPNLSVARHGAQPAVLGTVHPRFRTPWVSSLFIGCLAAALIVVFTVVSTDFLGDALLSIGLLICTYYSATALACVWHFRSTLLSSPRHLLLRGGLPLAGALMMLTALVLSARDMIDPAYGYTSFHGIGGVFVLGVGTVVAGLVVVAVLRPFFPVFFRTGRRTITDIVIEEV